MARILLVPAPSLSAGGRLHGYIPLGLLSLRAAAAPVADVDVLLPPPKLMEEPVGSSSALVAALLETVELDRYDAVGLSTMCGSFHHSLRLARQMRERAPEVPLWMGGPHATAVAEPLLAAVPEVDAVFVGEGEGAFAEAAARLSAGDRRLEGVPGISTRAGGLVPRPPALDLDDLPEAVLDEAEVAFLEGAASAMRRGLSVPLEVARGCPGRCTYCSTRHHFGGRVRRRSDRRVLRQMRSVAGSTGLRRFELMGDNFSTPLRKLLELCETMEAEGEGLEWQADLKLDRLRPEHLETLWRGGCRGFFVGVESASQQTLDRIRKGVRLDRELEVIRRAVELGFEVKTSFIVGFPWETADMVKGTYRLHARMLADGVAESQVWLLCPLPGTELTSGERSSLGPASSRLGTDGLPFDDETRAIVDGHPELFTHLRRFETPEVSLSTLRATVDAASQLRGLHGRRG